MVADAVCRAHQFEIWATRLRSIVTKATVGYRRAYYKTHACRYWQYSSYYVS